MTKIYESPTFIMERTIVLLALKQLVGAGYLVHSKSITILPKMP